MTQFGELSLWIALLMSAWCTTLAVQGAVTRRRSLVESAARGLQMALVFSLLAAGVLMRAFLDGDYSLRYVAMHSGSSVADAFKISAFWMGRAGLLLLVSVALAAAASVAARSAMRRDADRVRAAVTVSLLGAVAGGALAVTAFSGNAFTLFNQVPTDGRGLDPLFRHPLGLIQPLLMVCGLAAAAVPVALIVASAVRRRFDPAVVARIRGSAIASWGLLSLALLAGAQWAYVTPGLRARAQGTTVVVGMACAWVATMFIVMAASVRARRVEPRTPRHRVGQVTAQFGTVLCLAALAVSGRTKNYDVQIADGSRYSAIDAWGHSWTFTSQGESRIERPGDDVTALVLLPTRDGVRQPFLSSESRQYYAAGGLDIYAPQSAPAIRRGLAQDLLVILSDAEDGHAILRISFRPLIELAWVGGVLITLGTMLLFWPASFESAA